MENPEHGACGLSGVPGLMISPFTLGSMEFGSKVDEPEAFRLLDRANRGWRQCHRHSQRLCLSPERGNRAALDQGEGAIASSWPRNSPCLPTVTTRTLAALRAEQ